MCAPRASKRGTFLFSKSSHFPYVMYGPTRRQFSSSAHQIANTNSDTFRGNGNRSCVRRTGRRIRDAIHPLERSETTPRDRIVTQLIS
jgi:hypothetical protein